MVLSREKLFESIKERLEILAFSISNSGPLNLNNGAVLAENFYRDLLNLIYGWQLGNANFDHQNTADIDLADPAGDIFIQVTARNDRKKIADTLDSYYKKPENAGRRLQFLLISKEALKNQTFAAHKDVFNPTKDITDIKRLLKKINDLSTPGLEEVAAFLKKEFKLEGEQGPGNSATASASVGDIIINIGDKAKDKDPRSTPDSQKFYPAPFIPDLKYFVGREELLANLESTLNGHHKASIHDISGLGKTFACYKYADRNQANYSKIFFVNSAKEAMMESLARLGQMLHPGIEQAPQEQQAMAFKNWLETNENWLAIYDNVDEPASLAPFVPNQKKGDCLFTSNDWLIRSLGKEIQIDKLETENAALLLFRCSRGDNEAIISFIDDAEQTAFWKVVGDLDGLPVALNTTGAFIGQQSISYTEYLENLEVLPDLDLEHTDEFNPYKKTVLQAFVLAIDANTNVEDSSISEAVAELYRAASLVAPDDIPEEFLRAFLAQNSEGFVASERQNIFWQKIRKQFQGFDLFKYDSTAKSFSTHRLIQKCIQSRLGKGKKSYCEKVLDLLIDIFPEYDYDNKAECERYYQHTITALENADKAGGGVSASVYLRIAGYQLMLGSYGESEKFYERSLEITGNVFGEEHASTANALNGLAIIARAKGDYNRATAFRLRAMEINKTLFGEEASRYAVDLNNLAEVYGEQGRHDEAIELFERAMEIIEKTVGKEHPDYATCLNNLARIYLKQEVYDASIELVKEATKITGDALGQDHPDYAMRLNSLARIYFDTRRYFEALPLVEKALRILEAKLPSDHRDIANAKKGVEMCKEMLRREGSEEGS